MMKQVINIQEYLPTTITSRDAIEVLKSRLDVVDCSSFVFNFSGIDFVSRAFADELLHFIKNNNFSVEFENTNKNVAEILKAVNKNRSKRNSSFHKIAVTQFKRKEELNNFLSLI